jgi:hypothetical protein
MLCTTSVSATGHLLNAIEPNSIAIRYVDGLLAQTG